MYFYINIITINSTIIKYGVDVKYTAHNDVGVML